MGYCGYDAAMWNVAGRNLQPVLDDLGALNSDAHLQRHNRDTKSDVGGVLQKMGLFKHS